MSERPDHGFGAGRPSLVVDHVDVAAKRAGGNLKWGLDGPDVLPAWIAEHDLGPPPVVREAIRRLGDRPDVGYTRRADDLAGAFAAWAAHRHGWTPEVDLIVPTADVLQGIWTVTSAFTAPGEGVVITPPVYPNFHPVAPSLRRRSLECPLRHDSGRWRLDLDDLAGLLAAEPGARILLLCSPHNPTGHVYTAAELRSILELVQRHDLLVISDEIHADLVYPGARHIPTLTLPGAAERTVTLHSAGKSFAVSGLRAAVAVFGNRDLRARFERAVPHHLRGGVGRAGVEAAIAAWQQGGPWLDDLLILFDRHRRWLIDALASQLPDLSCELPASTFLAWLNVEAYDLGPNPAAVLVNKARIRLSEGHEFGTGGQNHVRLNFGTSTAVLEEMIDRLATALGA